MLRNERGRKEKERVSESIKEILFAAVLPFEEREEKKTKDWLTIRCGIKELL